MMRRTGRGRRTAVGAILAISGLVAAGCGAFGSEPNASADNSVIRIGLPTGVTSFANADVVVAQEMGFFDEAGLSVETQNFRSGVSVVQGVVGGALDIGGSSIEPVVNAHARGGEAVIIGSYTDLLTVSAVTPDSIARPEQLRGRQLGVQEVGAFREVMTRQVLASGGLTPDDVEYIPVDAQAYVSALLEGRIQSAILQREQAIAATRDDPNLHVLTDMNEVQPDYHYGTYFVSRSWLEDNRDAARGFLTAITRAHRFMYENRAETVRIVARATEYSEDIVDEAYQVLLAEQGVFPVNTGLDPERIDYTVGQMRELGILERDPPDFESIVDTGPINEVVGELGEWEGDPRWR